MFVGPDYLKAGTIPSVVIIGSGPAGMSLGVSLAKQKIPSLILEAGDTGYNHDIQDDYSGEITGDPYWPLDIARLRQFGGSSNHWGSGGAWCRPLDKWDFEAVPSMGIPAWPIEKSDLDPYKTGANAILEVPDPIDQQLGDGLFEAHFVYSPPAKFSGRYEAVVRTSSYLNVALRTAITALHAEDGRISKLDLVDANGGVTTISSDYVVLACGGIENSRLLLWSNYISQQRVVGRADALGRYWMEHPHEQLGDVLLTRAIHVNPRQVRTFSVSMEPARLKQYGALNASVRLFYPRTTKFLDRVRGGICEADPELIKIANLIAQTSAKCGSRAKVVWEQAPVAENRVALSEIGQDRYGIPRSHLFWKKTPQDYRTARVAFELVGAHIIRSDAGVVRADPHLIAMKDYPETGEFGGYHHMGGTRMSTSPSEGVVDRNLRIHGLSNGYIAGSSVFVRGGHANPTYTIVQLSLRLADHLAARLNE